MQMEQQLQQQVQQLQQQVQQLQQGQAQILAQLQRNQWDMARTVNENMSPAERLVQLQLPAGGPQHIPFPQSKRALQAMTSADAAAVLQAYGQPVPARVANRRSALAAFIGVQ